MVKNRLIYIISEFVSNHCSKLVITIKEKEI